MAIIFYILKQLNIFTDEERELTLQRLHSKKLDDRFEIGIKKLLMNLEVASQSSNKVDKFVQTIYAARVSIRYTENTSGARYT
jgi:hypothetical protein